MDDKPHEPSTAFCLFPCKSRPLAVSLDVVAGVMETGRLVQLPLCPHPVVGLCTYRGAFIPVVLPALETDGRRSAGSDRESSVLVLRTGHGDLGLLIDREGISIANDCDVSPQGALGSQRREDSALPTGFVIVGTVARNGKVHSVLDPERTWQGLRSVIDHWYGTSVGNRASATASRAG
jgi:chemotaxis signal transduction protein